VQLGNERKLRRDLGQDIHSPDFGRDPKVGARPLFYTQNPGVAANPAFFPGGQFGREDED